MTREVKVVSWCDMCEADGERNEGQPHEIAGVVPAPVEIDLCERHEVEIGLRSLATALTKFGRPTHTPVAKLTSQQRRGRQPDRRDLVCPFCPITYAGTTSLRTHLIGVHGLAIAGQTGIGDLFGQRCPLCGEPAALLLNHSRNVHGVSWGEVYRQALAAGDPFKLCAPVERRAREVAR
jgi:hypothetical protein